MSTLIALNKPYGVLSQFTPDHPGQETLESCALPAGVYAAGRLDADSEGLLLLTDDGRLQARLTDPRHGHEREYHVQVEGEVDETALVRLRAGVQIRGGQTRPARARLLTDPGYPPRVPPIRERKAIPTSWLALELTEGRNRQVRRMTAAVGFPTLRLIRVRIGGLHLFDQLRLAPGEWCLVQPAQVLAGPSHP